MPGLTRRSLLAGAALLPLAGCTRRDERVATAPLRDLERRSGRVVAVHAVHTGTGRELAHRAGRRFAFCSTFKGLAAAALLDRRSLAGLDELVRFDERDLMESSSVTRDHVETGITLRAVCDAAVRFSDGTAGNLLLREIGGPAGLTRYLRGLGDDRTRCDRFEPHLARSAPGDARDTTTPRAIAADYRKIVLGDALPARERAFLRDLLERNTTGANRIRAGLPRGWKVADRTGTGNYGVANDIAIAWPPDSAPLVIAVMSRGRTEGAPPDESVVAEAARIAAAALTER